MDSCSKACNSWRELTCIRSAKRSIRARHCRCYQPQLYVLLVKASKHSRSGDTLNTRHSHAILSTKVWACSARRMPGSCLSSCQQALTRCLDCRPSAPLPAAGLRAGIPPPMPHIMPNPRWLPRPSHATSAASPSLSRGTGVFSSGSQSSGQPGSSIAAAKAGIQSSAPPPTHASRWDLA